MELKDTVQEMLDEDYKERFKAEYHQLQIRYDKLTGMIEKYKNGTLGFTPSCSVEFLENQCRVMREYLSIMRKRSEIENIKL